MHPTSALCHRHIYPVISIALVVFSVTAIFGCARKPTKIAVPSVMSADASLAKATLFERKKSIKSFRALGKITLRSKHIETSDIAILLLMPDKFRAEAYDSLADVVAILGSNGNRMWARLPIENKSYSGRSSKSALKKALGIECDPRELIHTLSGNVDIGEDDFVREVNSHFVVPSKKLEIWIDLKRGFPTRVVQYSDGALTRAKIDVQFLDYKRVGQDFIPNTVQMNFIDNGTYLTVEYKHIELNRDVDDALFEEPV